METPPKRIGKDSLDIRAAKRKQKIEYTLKSKHKPRSDEIRAQEIDRETRDGFSLTGVDLRGFLPDIHTASGRLIDYLIPRIKLAQYVELESLQWVMVLRRVLDVIETTFRSRRQGME